MSKDKKKKPLLEEGTFRRWGQLSGIRPLTPIQLKEYGYGLEEEVDEFEDEEEEVEVPVGDEAPVEEPAGDELPPEDLEDEGEVEASPEEEAVVSDLVTAIADAISAETGIEIEVEGGEAVGDEEELEIGDDLPAEEPEGEELPPEDLEGGMEDGLEDEEEIEESAKNPYEGAKSHKLAEKPLPKKLSESVIAEIAKNVARRLVEKSKRSKKVVKRNK